MSWQSAEAEQRHDDGSDDLHEEMRDILPPHQLSVEDQTPENVQRFHQRREKRQVHILVIDVFRVLLIIGAFASTLFLARNHLFAQTDALVAVAVQDAQDRASIQVSSFLLAAISEQRAVAKERMRTNRTCRSMSVNNSLLDYTPDFRTYRSVLGTYTQAAYEYYYVTNQTDPFIKGLELWNSCGCLSLLNMCYRTLNQSTTRAHFDKVYGWGPNGTSWMTNNTIIHTRASYSPFFVSFVKSIPYSCFTARQGYWGQPTVLRLRSSSDIITANLTLIPYGVCLSWLGSPDGGHCQSASIMEIRIDPLFGSALKAMAAQPQFSTIALYDARNKSFLSLQAPASSASPSTAELGALDLVVAAMDNVVALRGDRVHFATDGYIFSGVSIVLGTKGELPLYFLEVTPDAVYYKHDRNIEAAIIVVGAVTSVVAAIVTVAQFAVLSVPLRRFADAVRELGAMRRSDEGDELSQELPREAGVTHLNEQLTIAKMFRCVFPMVGTVDCLVHELKALVLSYESLGHTVSVVRRFLPQSLLEPQQAAVDGRARSDLKAEEAGGNVPAGVGQSVGATPEQNPSTEAGPGSTFASVGSITGIFSENGVLRILGSSSVVLDKTLSSTLASQSDVKLISIATQTPSGSGQVRQGAVTRLAEAILRKAPNHFSRKSCTVMTMALQMPRNVTCEAEQLQTVLTAFLEIVVPVVSRHGGVIDQMRPDIVVAYFDSENLVHSKSHTSAATDCVLEIYESLHLGIRSMVFTVLDTGEYYCGTCGNEQRLARALVGPRLRCCLDLLELSMGCLRSPILITERVAASLLQRFALFPADFVRDQDNLIFTSSGTLRGAANRHRQDAVQRNFEVRQNVRETIVFELCGGKALLRDQYFVGQLKRYREGFSHILRGAWSDGVRCLNTISHPILKRHSERLCSSSKWTELQRISAHRGSKVGIGSGSMLSNGGFTPPNTSDPPTQYRSNEEQLTAAVKVYHSGYVRFASPQWELFGLLPPILAAVANGHSTRGSDTASQRTNGSASSSHTQSSGRKLIDLPAAAAHASVTVLQPPSKVPQRTLTQNSSTLSDLKFGSSVGPGSMTLQMGSSPLQGADAPHASLGKQVIMVGSGSNGSTPSEYTFHVNTDVVTGMGAVALEPSPLGSVPNENGSAESALRLLDQGEVESGPLFSYNSNPLASETHSRSWRVQTVSGDVAPESVGSCNKSGAVLSKSTCPPSGCTVPFVFTTSALHADQLLSTDRVWHRSDERLGEGPHHLSEVFQGIAQQSAVLVAVKVYHFEEAYQRTHTPNTQADPVRDREISLRCLLRDIHVQARCVHENILGVLGVCVFRCLEEEHPQASSCGSSISVPSRCCSGCPADESHSRCGKSDERRLCGGLVIVVSEFMSCGSLATLRRQFGRIPYGCARRFALDIARGLAYLHSQSVAALLRGSGDNETAPQVDVVKHQLFDEDDELVMSRPCVHGNLRPSNVLIATDGSCKLADFGPLYFSALQACRSLLSSKPPLTADCCCSSTIKCGGSVNGNVMTIGADNDKDLSPLVAYVAPEMIDLLREDKEEASLLDEAFVWTPAADVFAFGVVLYELVTNELPWNASGGRSEPTRRLPLHVARDDSLLLSLRMRPTSTISCRVDWDTIRSNVDDDGSADMLTDLLESTLHEDPAKRVSMEAVLRHPVFL